MLVDMATQPVSVDIDRPAILDYQLPALGVGIAGSTALAAPSTIRASKTDLKFASRAPGVERKKPGIAKTGLRVLGRGLGVAAYLHYLHLLQLVILHHRLQLAIHQWILQQIH